MPATPQPRHSLLRGTVVALVCGLLLLAGATPAFAHTRLTSSDPADGASVDTAPARITLTFNEAIPAEFATITVIGPEGAAHQTGPVTASNTTVSTAVLPLTAAGRYQVGYRVVSDDGHPITGSLTFTLTAAAAPFTAASPTPSEVAATPTAAPQRAASAPRAEQAGAPVWPWIVGAVVLVGLGVVSALRLSRK